MYIVVSTEEREAGELSENRMLNAVIIKTAKEARSHIGALYLKEGLPEEVTKLRLQAKVLWTIYTKLSRSEPSNRTEINKIAKEHQIINKRAADAYSKTIKTLSDEEFWRISELNGICLVKVKFDT